VSSFPPTNGVDEGFEGFWKEHGVSNMARLKRLAGICKGGKFRDTRDLRRAVDDIAIATRRCKTTDAVRLIERAPGLLNYSPSTLTRKIGVLESYLIGVDVMKMVTRQPTLLCRDIDGSTVAKIGTLLDMVQDEDAVCTMLQRQPAILFIDATDLMYRLEMLHDLLIDGLSGGRGNECDSSEARAMIAMAPSLVCYNIETVSFSIEEWRMLDPRLCGVWRKMPSLLQCDFDTTIAPKIRILRRVLKGADEEAVTDLLVANPSFLAYSKSKYARLLYECQGGLRIEKAGVRRTLKDRSVGEWLQRAAYGDEVAYTTWLKNRIEAITVSTNRRSASSVGQRKGADTDDLAALEKLHSALFAVIALALLGDGDDG